MLVRIFLLKSEYPRRALPNAETACRYLWLRCEPMLSRLLFHSQSRNFLNTWANVCSSRNTLLHWVSFWTAPCYLSGRESSVGIATFTGWTVFSSKVSGSDFFSYPPDWLLCPPSLPYNGYRFTLPTVNLSGRGCDHPPIFSTEVCVGRAAPLMSFLYLHGVLQGDVYHKLLRHMVLWPTSTGVLISP